MPTEIKLVHRDTEGGGLPSKDLDDVKLLLYCKESSGEVFGRLWKEYGIVEYNDCDVGIYDNFSTPISSWGYGLSIKSIDELPGADIHGTIDDLVEESGIFRSNSFDYKDLSKQIIENLSGSPEVLVDLMPYLVDSDKLIGSDKQSGFGYGTNTLKV